MTASPLLRALLMLLALAVTGPAFANREPAREVDWLELMPKDEVEAMMAASAAAQLSVDHNKMGEQTGSFRAMPEFDNQRIKLAGYIVPVQTTADGQLSEFFLVPYFGACIHVPPPPPNQIVYARLEKPIPMTEIYDAFWVTGTMKIERFQNDIAATAYTMAVEDVRLYE
jgi:hypothetical protein